MITGITLQNFKGIGEPVLIPLKPITLMFGANSSGKSTIIQAIHYAREILERNNVNPDKTLAGGSSIDLGGFRSLVHNHDLDLPITLRFDLDLTHSDLPDYSTWARYMMPGDYADNTAPDISGRVESAFVELVVMWSNIKERPIVKSYLVGLNGDPVVRTRASIDEAQFTLEVNPSSKVFMDLLGHEFDFDFPYDATAEPDPWYPIYTKELTQALPQSWDRPIFVEGGNPFLDNEPFSLYLTQMLLGPGQILSSLLNKFRYLGPIRSIPKKNHQPALTPDDSGWADGIAAWDALHRQGDDTLIIDVHHWMSDERLKTGYNIVLNEFREIPSHSELYAALSSNTLLDDIENVAEEFNKFPVRTRLRVADNEKFLEVQPSDIGVGISQVVPVIVIALDTRDGIIAIEQPELHLHPAMQAELGDLFIESALGKTQNRFIIETHSEHLILRLLRRIRETSEDSLPSPDMRLTPADVQILYVRQEGDGVKIHDLEITAQNEFARDWPDGFFAERAKELF